MKTKKTTALSLMIAATACSALLGGAMLGSGVTAAADETAFAPPHSVALKEIFMATQEADIGFETVTVGEESKDVAAFTLADNETVKLKRDLAFEWFEAKGEQKFFSIDFAFSNLDFKTVTLKMQMPTAWATKDGKAENTVTFTNDNGAISVKVNDAETSTPLTYTAGQKLTLAFSKTLADGVTEVGYGEYAVYLSESYIGTFTNVGKRSATYAYESMHPLEFVVDFGDAATDNVGGKTTKVLIYQINGQEFYKNDGDKIDDTAAPVLVVNEDVDGFLLGSNFTLDYDVIDVLQNSGFPSGSTMVEYYQYDPAKTVEEDEFAEHKKSASESAFESHNFFQTIVGDTAVHNLTGEEYVVIRFVVGDSTHTGATGHKSKVTYDLAWYLPYVNVPAHEALRASTLDYISLKISDRGPSYKIVSVDETNHENVKSADYDAQVADFNEKLAELAEDIHAGSNASLNLPSLNWLLQDDQGYGNMRFTISYKAESSTSMSSTTVSPSAAKIPVSKEGLYEFKVCAVDGVGNPMKYYLDGELVEVTKDNIWDIEEIPYFYFSIANVGLEVNYTSYTTETSRKATEVKDKTYSFNDVSVVGATDLEKAYKLYRVTDFTAYNQTLSDSSKALSGDDLAKVSYLDLANAVKEKGLSTANGNYFALYLREYATLLAKSKGYTPTPEQVTALVGCFDEITEYGDRVNGTEEDQKYEWKSDSRTFKTVEEGYYLMLADYWERAAAGVVRAPAYRALEVESEAAIIGGEDNWFEENTLSIILFAIAGVMLLGIIILLMIKPSDEKLEDLDEKADDSEEKQDKKAKKEKVKKEKMPKAPKAPKEKKVKAKKEKAAEETAESVAEETPAEEVAEPVAEETPAEEAVEETDNA